MGEGIMHDDHDNEFIRGRPNTHNDLIAFDGDDTLVGGSNFGSNHGSNTFYGIDGGHDTMIGGNGHTINTFFALGDDAVMKGGTNTFFGGEAPDGVTMYGGNHATNVMFAEDSNTVEYGGSHSTNLFLVGTGDDVLYGGSHSNNVFIFDDRKFAPGSLDTSNPTPLADQSQPGVFLNSGHDIAHGSTTNDGHNTIELRGAASTWTIHVTSGSYFVGSHGELVANPGSSLGGTISSNNGSNLTVSFDHMKVIMFAA
jgi:hypothetical protein